MSLLNHTLGQLFKTVEMNPQKIAIILDDQMWTYGELIEQIRYVTNYLFDLKISKEQIIYQFVERSLEMIVGLISIMYVGGIYCPLNPTDPSERLISLIEQTHGQYVLLHEKTRRQFPSVPIQQMILLDEILAQVQPIDELPVCIESGPALIVCTSGTTGRSKIIVHTHESLYASITAYTQWNLGLYTYQNQILQVATSSWILHITEILLPLVVGGSLILLRPNGHLDISYFVQTLIHQQVTTLTIGTSIVRALTNYLELTQQLDTFVFVRKICLTGESIKSQSVINLNRFSRLFNTRICVQYGMSECNTVLGCELIDFNEMIVPIGYPLPGIRCLLIDEQGQIIDRNNTNDVGQIHIGGSTLFNCYLNDVEYTITAFTSINQVTYLKTGDLARYNTRGELVHIGRIDFQIKIRGQRVETHEIENRILKYSPEKISNCLVTKISQNDDYLVAYILSNDSNLNIDLIREYCSKYLCQYMVPYHIIILDQFPLNINGKIDRNKLPLPSILNKRVLQLNDKLISNIEEKVYNLWCRVLRLDTISYDRTCFALGGSSLSLMELFSYYKFYFEIDKQLNIADFFLNPTINNHIQLLINSKTKENNLLKPLHLIKGVASFAQQRLWIDEQIRFNQSMNVYNELLIYRLKPSTSFSVHHFRHALKFLVTKHSVLRTALIYEQDKLIQKILPISDDLYDFQITSIIDDDQLNEILYDEETNRDLFNLEQGRVFRCHVIRYFSDSEQNDIIIVFNFHHVAIDGSSIPIFIKDLQYALTTQEVSHSQKDTITYLDYAQYERLEDWSNAQEFWRNALISYNNTICQQTSSIRTGKGYTVTFNLDHDVVIKLNQFISESSLTLFQVGLAAFFTFLFKISNNQQLDYCIGIIAANRLQHQLQNMMGFFANMIPFYLKIDPYESFTQFCYRIQQHWFEILPHVHLPYQEILKLNPNIESSFIRTFFQVETIIDDNIMELNDGTTLNRIRRNVLTDHTAKFDMACALYENRQNETISVSMNASLDIYDKETIDMIASRFKIMLEQVLSVSSIYKVSLLLPNEDQLIHDLNNTFHDYGQVSCIHQEFVYQVVKHPQKLAVELDDQSLTYAELLHYVQWLSLYLLDNYQLVSGEIICLCVERSISMVIGMMAILMSGCVYCPLSPDDPQQRLHSLVQQTQSRLVFVDQLTKTKFSTDMTILNVEELIINYLETSEINVEQLSTIIVTPDSIANVIFTSGSTGIPKAVRIRHRNFINFMYSLVHTGIFNNNDTVLQLAACTFDVHLQEIFGTLMFNATVIMLHPFGNMDFMYLVQTLQNKQISYMQAVPSFLNSFSNFIQDMDKLQLPTLRSLCCGGEIASHKTMRFFRKKVRKSCRMWNLYGSTETTIVSTYHEINLTCTETNIPIGRPLTNYKCLIIDEFFQPVIIDQQGELLVGGIGVFAGYLALEDLTNKALIKIDSELYYRTGDIVHMDTNGLLHYHGRKDHQIKLHGQRIELDEIEQCLLSHTFIESCIVMKYDDDHLIGYVQSSAVNEIELREHCEVHFPSYMIPSVFIILEEFPLNSNGKIDRKQLPSPDFSSLSSKNLQNMDALLAPRNKIESIIHRIWCDIFQHNGISIDTNIFHIGGHSLLLMQIFHRYKTQFCLNTTTTFSIADLFQSPTILGHTQLIEKDISVIINIDNDNCCSLHLTRGKASFAQERIFLDERIRFASNDNHTTYAIPLLYRILSDTNHLSLSRLMYALQSVIRKHSSLRTALYLDTNGTLIQDCLNANTVIDNMKLCEISVINNEEDVNKTINNILKSSNLFDISKGHVIQCHILRKDHNENDLLTKDDLILFTIHHAAFDGASISLFLRDLSLAYDRNGALSTNDNVLQYIDYSVHERLLDMTSSRQFWSSQLQHYNFNQPLLLPVDRYRISNHPRSSHSSTARFIFDKHMTQAFLNYASSHHLTLFHVGLATFYTFLYKLNQHHQNDLCITCLNANRYQSQLQNIIGMFVSLLPYRMIIDAEWSFDELVQHVQQQSLSILEHAHYPLQSILSDHHLNQSNLAFLETVFDFVILSSDMKYVTLDGIQLEQMRLEECDDVAKFDFSLTFVYDPKSSDNDDDELYCSFVCSQDLFDETTVVQLAQRFKHLCEQLFLTASDAHSDKSITFVRKLSLILPEEAEEIQTVVFRRLVDITNEVPASYAQARIWLDEHIRFHADKPPVAIYNMSFVYHLRPNCTLSVKQLRHALKLVIIKHPSLRTSLVFNTEKNTLMQRIIELNDNEFFTFSQSTFETDKQLNDILYDEQRNSQHFDLTNGLVFRCHIVYYKQISENDLICHQDIIVFNFHHALFDFLSLNTFLTDLNEAYTTNQIPIDDNSTLRYVDYTVIEQEMLMNGAKFFWLDTLHGCNLDQSLSLPYDRYRLSNESRTGRGTSINFHFDRNLSHQFFTYASLNNFKPIDLALAIYYVFLFKITNGENDLCIGMNTNGRYREELKSIIGMFVNAIPLRCKLDPHWTVQQLVKYVQDILNNSLKYSYYPLQHILAQHSRCLKPAFLDTSFEFHMIENSEEWLNNGNFSLISYPVDISVDEVISKFDFGLTIEHDLNSNELSCTLTASLDLFDAMTLQRIAQRFYLMLQQLFVSGATQMERSIYQLSLILPDENMIMQSLNNTQTERSDIRTISYEFVYQVVKHPQKLAVELDDQSLTYAELLHYVQWLSLYLLHNYQLVSGEIICLCVERSISMVIGMMAIVMSGCVYCPLSPDDPQQRLHSLVQQTQNRLVLVHCSTKTKFNGNAITFDITYIFNNNETIDFINVDRLESVVKSADSIAYIVFTSGSTGLPKAAQIRHQNFIGCIDGFIHIGLFNSRDTIVQMASCSYDSHVLEILGALIVGCSIVMLHPQGNLDFNYLWTALNQKEVSYIQSVPAYLTNMIDFFTKQNYPTPNNLRTIDLGGDISTVHLIEKIYSYFSTDIRIWNFYGLAEMTIACTFHLVALNIDNNTIPIGRPLSNYKCIVVDEFGQKAFLGQQGELLVGGVGVFAGYLALEQLTNTVLVKIDDELYYRTGDIVHIDTSGLLHYHGRKDHQIKLHGQRIELDEIEQCLLNHTSIESCIVMKYDDDHLIGYVQSSDVNEVEVREHCESHLPPYMIPSLFIILKKFPLNSNGKIDRKQLSSPIFSTGSILLSSVECDTNHNPLLNSLRNIWCQVLQYDGKDLLTTASFFSMGGHSLMFIELYHRYQSLFGFDSHKLSITLFLQQPTIFQHARLLETIITDNIQSNQWSPLHLYQGIASFAQERIFLDEQIRFSNTNGIYNEVILLRSVRGKLSIDRLSKALEHVLNKHKILRTALVFNYDEGLLKQYITDYHRISTLVNKRTFKTKHELLDIIREITVNPNLFDPPNGRVFYCAVLKQENITFENHNTDLMAESDILMLAFHHIALDRASLSIFFNELSNFYNENTDVSCDEQSLQYIDYSVHERLLDMTSSRQFWSSQLQHYNFNQPLLLPVDRYRISNHPRSSHSSTARFIFDKHMTQAFLDYASSHHLTLFHLGLATFYTFLYKLNQHHQNDLCITCLNANRYQSQLQNIIGMFVSLLPYRMIIDAEWSFDELVHHVQQQSLSILEHSHYPLQSILSDHHVNQSNLAFLETVFDFVILSSDMKYVTLDGIQLEQMRLEECDGVAKFDFSLTFVYNPKSSDDGDDELYCSFVCSQDLFDVVSTEKIAQRFGSMLQQLFVPSGYQMKKPIYELSLTLPDENILMKSLNNVQIELSHGTHISYEFVGQVMTSPQKLAVELDDQSLTYSELLYYVQLLSLEFLNNYNVVPGEIICQCVERSISMVLGMMAIVMSGCVYCPLSPNDPKHRLDSLIEQTQSRLIVVDWLTKIKFNDGLATVVIDSVIISNGINIDIDIHPLSTLDITADDVAYIIFTSGSTGTPKAVQIQHRHFIQCMSALVFIGIMNRNDTVAQIARCSFDVHVLDILGTLIVGGTVIMLYPQGILDFDYLILLMEQKQITYLQAVPSFLQALFTFLTDTNNFTGVKYLKTLCSSGEPCTTKLIKLLINCIEEKCQIWNLYGPAETIICTYHHVSPALDKETIPIGLTMPNYRCLIIDEFCQPVMIDQQGELLVGGIGVFAGYLASEDLTNKALVKIDDELYYRTGDIVHIDTNGLLHYHGRKDHQIKLHGQRIELDEIEQCLLKHTSVESCIVMQYDDDHLIGYVESSDVNEVELREYCELHLPSYMIPCVFIILEEFPLNSNGKIDRKLLPKPQFPAVDDIDPKSLLFLSPLEEKLRDIFIKAFHNESPEVNMSFGKMGGTSLDAIKALWLIRQEVYSQMDANVLFTNPSIRQLAQAIEPLLVAQENVLIQSNSVKSFQDQKRVKPSLCIELVGIVLLICQWSFPIWLVYQTKSSYILPMMPIFHLLSYIICQRLMFWSEKTEDEVDKLYSWHYYRWWFLNSMWSINNVYWLKHLLGTPFYNTYLRLCGAKIGSHTYIHTTLIDAPWLIEIGESTFIGEDVIFSTLSYQDQTYKLDQIRIGSCCSISTRCVLYEGVVMDDHTYVPPMSSITGHIVPSTCKISPNDRSLPVDQKIYQFICLSCLLAVHSMLLFKVYFIYYYCSTWLLPASMSLALAWLIWSLTSLFVVLFILKYVVGIVTSGHYPINSYYYLHKIWLRQLIINSFHYSLDLIPSYNIFVPIILRWLGVPIKHDDKFAEFRPMLNSPSNLLHIEHGVTTFGGVKFVSFEITEEGFCYVHEIYIGAPTNPGNWCTLMPGARLQSKSTVGSLALITRETVNEHMNSVLLGIPGCEMPFIRSEYTSIINDLSFSSNSIPMYTLLITCLSFFMSKYSMISLYFLSSGSLALFIHLIIFYTASHGLTLFMKRDPNEKVKIFIQEYFHLLKTDFVMFIGSYLSGTQFLIYLYHLLDVRIDFHIILPDISCLTDPHLATIGNHVRLNPHTYIQCHTFEQRLLKIGPIALGSPSILMSNTLIVAGSRLAEQNCILPCTLIMKNDYLQSKN